MSDANTEVEVDLSPLISKLKHHVYQIRTAHPDSKKVAVAINALSDFIDGLKFKRFDELFEIRLTINIGVFK